MVWIYKYKSTGCHNQIYINGASFYGLLSVSHSNINNTWVGNLDGLEGVGWIRVRDKFGTGYCSVFCLAIAYSTSWIT